MVKVSSNFSFLFHTFDVACGCKYRLDVHRCFFKTYFDIVLFYENIITHRKCFVNTYCKNIYNNFVLTKHYDCDIIML